MISSLYFTLRRAASVNGLASAAFFFFLAGAWEALSFLACLLYTSMGRAMKAGAKGIKLMCSGRLGGAEIARTEGYHCLLYTSRCV